MSRYVPEPLPDGRPAKWPRREIVNAILYVLRSGCKWELLPHDFPPYKTVYDYYRQWRRCGLWEQVNPTGMVVTIRHCAKDYASSLAVIRNRVPPSLMLTSMVVTIASR